MLGHLEQRFIFYAVNVIHFHFCQLLAGREMQKSTTKSSIKILFQKTLEEDEAQNRSLFSGHLSP